MGKETLAELGITRFSNLVVKIGTEMAKDDSQKKTLKLHHPFYMKFEDSKDD